MQDTYTHHAIHTHDHSMPYIYIYTHTHTHTHTHAIHVYHLCRTKVYEAHAGGCTPLALVNAGERAALGKYGDVRVVGKNAFVRVLHPHGVDVIHEHGDVVVQEIGQQLDAEQPEIFLAEPATSH